MTNETDETTALLADVQARGDALAEDLNALVAGLDNGGMAKATFSIDYRVGKPQFLSVKVSKRRWFE